MVKEFRKLNEKAYKMIHIKTDTFNEMLKDLGASISVVRRDKDLEESYQTYRSWLNESGAKDVPLSKELYEERYYNHTCAFDCGNEKEPAEKLIETLLGIRNVSVRYTKEQDGWTSNDELEITYYDGKDSRERRLFGGKQNGRKSKMA